MSLSAAEVNENVEGLYKAFKGFGKDSDAIISILSKNSGEQLQQIAIAYKTAYGEDLIKRLKSELSGNFENLAVALCTPLREFEATCIRNACKGIGTNESELINILAGRTNQEIKEIKDAFKSVYDKDCEKTVADDLGGKCKRLFVGLLQGSRDETGTISTVEDDVESLYKAGEGKWGTDETEFIKFFNTRSHEHLKQVFDAYLAKYNRTFHEVIKKEFSGDLRDMLIGMIESTQSRPLFYARLFDKAMKGMGTNEKLLNSLAVRSRDPELLKQIHEEFAKIYNKSLVGRVKSEVSGNYEKLLVAIIDLK